MNCRQLIENVMKRKWIASLFLVFFQITSFVCACSFGYSSDGVERTERMLFADKYLADYSGTGYVHGSVYFDEGTELNEALQLQNSFRSNLSSGGSYVVAGSGIPTYFPLLNAESLGFDAVTVCGLHTFSDRERMECLPIPMYRGSGYRFGGNSIQNGFKCYISNKMADSILSKSKELTNYDDLIDGGYQFDAIAEDGITRFTFKVVDIYMLDNDKGLLDEDDYSYYVTRFDSFNNRFYDFNKFAVFTYGPQIFNSSGFHLSYDIKQGFGHIRDYYFDHVGYDFLSRGWTSDLVFINKDGQIENMNEVLGLDTCFYEAGLLDGGNMVAFAFMLIFGLLAVACLFWLEVIIVKSGYLRPALFSILIASFPFVCIGLAASVLFSFFNTLALNLLINFIGMGWLAIETIILVAVGIVVGRFYGRD